MAKRLLSIILKILLFRIFVIAAAGLHTLNLSLYGVSFPSDAYGNQEGDPASGHAALHASLERHLTTFRNKAILLRLMPSDEEQQQVSATPSASSNTGAPKRGGDYLSAEAAGRKSNGGDSSEEQCLDDSCSESEGDADELASCTPSEEYSSGDEDGDACHAAIIYVGLFAVRISPRVPTHDSIYN